jgi:GNAT superfamily N-acetyltransferase
VTARPASDPDIPRLIDLINSAYQPAEGHFIAGDRIGEAELRRRMANGQFLVLDGSDESLAACIYLRVNGDRAYFGLLAVDPGRQMLGIGGRLLYQAEAYCAARGCIAIDIDVVDLRTELIRRYEARGFRRTGTAPFEDARLTRPAHFVTMSKHLHAAR